MCREWTSACRGQGSHRRGDALVVLTPNLLVVLAPIALRPPGLGENITFNGELRVPSRRDGLRRNSRHAPRRGPLSIAQRLGYRPRRESVQQNPNTLRCSARALNGGIVSMFRGLAHERQKFALASSQQLGDGIGFRGHTRSLSPFRIGANIYVSESIPRNRGTFSSSCPITAHRDARKEKRSGPHGWEQTRAGQRFLQA